MIETLSLARAEALARAPPNRTRDHELPERAMPAWWARFFARAQATPEATATSATPLPRAGIDGAARWAAATRLLEAADCRGECA